MEAFEQFNGIDTGSPRARLPQGTFQVDQNGDRFIQGSWRRRRGMRRTCKLRTLGIPFTLAGSELSNGEFATLIGSSLELRGLGEICIQEDAAADSGDLLSVPVSPNHRFTAAEYRGVIYLANGWGSMVRWRPPEATSSLAGILGPDTATGSWTPPTTPSAGAIDPGVHVFRYRYKDSSTGAISNPSEERGLRSTTGTLTFPIGAPGSGSANIIRSTDPKVDRIVVEMTLVGTGSTGESGTSFFVATEVANTATSVAVSIGDDALSVKFLPYADLDVHFPSPVAKYVVSHRDHLWSFGQVRHEVGLARFTAGSVDVLEGAVNPDWNGQVLGDPTATPPLTRSVSWQIQKVGDSRTYEISHYDPGLTKIVLNEPYAGATSPAGGDSYVIYTDADVIWVSGNNKPESFSPEQFINAPSHEGAGQTTAALGFGSSMILYSQAGMSRFAWDQDPLAPGASLRTIGTGRGAISQRVVAKIEGTLYAMDRQGFHRYRGTFPDGSFARPVKRLVLEQVDFSKEDTFHALWIPEQRSCRWFVHFKGDSAVHPTRYIEYDYDTGAWGTGLHLQEIVDSQLIPTSEGWQPVVSDEGGHTWVYDTGNSDGVSSAVSHLTVNGAAPPTVIPVNEALPIVNEGIRGTFAYSPDNDEFRKVTANTATTLTIASSFTSSLTDGQELWIGAFESVLKTPALTARSSAFKRRTGHLSLGFEPTAASREIQLRFFEDYSAARKVWDFGTGEAYEGGAGITWPATAADEMVADSAYPGGAVEVGAGTEWSRALEAEVRILEPDTDVEIYHLSFDPEFREDQNSG